MKRLAALLLLLSLPAAGCGGGGGGANVTTASSLPPAPPAPPVPAPALDFITSPVVAALSNPPGASALQVADLDGDGRVDVGMASGSTLTIFLADAGAYTTRQDYPAGPISEALAFADLEGDGDPDAILSTTANGTGLVTVLRNRGNGTFALGVSIQSGDATGGAVAAADFTGDGLPDVVAGGDTRVTLLANDGTGALLPPVTVAALGNARCLAAVPRPGQAADLLVGTNEIQLLENDGTGNFTPGPDGPMPGMVLDLSVVGSEVVGLTLTEAQVFRLPDMVPVQTLAIASADARAVTAADAEQDGDLDLVVLAGETVNLFTRGPAGFSLAWTRAQGANMSSARTVDVNGDGRADLALWDGSGLLGTALGTPDGTFGLPRTQPLPSTGIAIATGDFGGSGPDLVTLQVGSANAWRNDGTGNFTAQPPVSVSAFHPGQASSYLRVADLNRDRLLDLVTAGGGTTFAQASLATSPGNFQVAGQFGNVAPGGLDVGDYDGDGHPDIALGDAQSDTLLLGEGQGDGTFTLLGQSGSTGFGGNYQWLESGDFNGDTLLDLVAMMANGDVWGLRGQISFDFLEDIQPVPTSGRFFRLLPLSGGELPDLFWCGNGAFGIDPSNGNSTFTPFVDTPDVGFPGAINSSAVGDFDGDGNLDLAMLGDATVRILTGNGDGTFSAPDAMPHWFAGGATAITAGDYNGDGRLDLATVGGSGLVILLHR